MAVHSIQSILAGLEFSPVPHLLVEGGRVVGATSTCSVLLGCERDHEIQNTDIKQWIVDYDPNAPDNTVVRVQSKAGAFFEALLVRKGVSLSGRYVEVISINHISEPQMQKTAEDLNLLSHVLTPSITQLTDFLESTTPQEGLEVPRLRRVSIDLNDGLQKFRFYKILEHGSLANIPSRFNPRELLTQIIESKRILHADRWEICTHLPVYMDNVVLDREKLKFIVDEILQNAIVHNESGKIDVAATEEDLYGSKRLVITIRDNGKGFVWSAMDPEIGGSSPVKRSDSGGIGLSICSTFAKAMNGSLMIVSGEGRGSTVKLTLPYFLPQGSQMPMDDGQYLSRDRSMSDPLRKSPVIIDVGSKSCVSAASTPRGVEEKKDPITFNYRALIVEDNLLNTKILRRMLEGMGLQCDVAEDGQVAVDKVGANPFGFDVIFMDLLMPRMDGFEATEIIKQIGVQKGKNIPIIACTANTEDDQKCKEAQMSGVVHKPVKKEALQQMLLNISEKPQ
ncbi:MAG: response regulator [Verrucomicrobia bacterium]|nr:response regulator [Verrucomicrobiota bacterium]